MWSIRLHPVLRGQRDVCVIALPTWTWGELMNRLVFDSALHVEV